MIIDLSSLADECIEQMKKNQNMQMYDKDYKTVLITQKNCHMQKIQA